MASLTREALAWAAEHHHTITTSMLRQCGISGAQQERLVRDGALTTAQRRVRVQWGEAR